MSVDLKKLSPAPWDSTVLGKTSEEEARVACSDGAGMVIFCTANSDVVDIEEDWDESGGIPIAVYRDTQGIADLEFCVAARNALGFQMRQRLTVYAVDGKFNIAHPLFPDICIASAADPITAVLLAEKWYQAESEAKG